MKRLGEVIVGAGIKSGDLSDTSPRADRISTLVSQSVFLSSEYGHAVDTGKVEVEYHEVEGLNVQ